MIDPRPAVEPTGASNSVFQLSPRDRKRMGWAAALSIYYHALVISLQFGATGFSVFGITIPYPQKRVDSRSPEARVADEPRQPALALKTAPLPSPEWGNPEQAKQPRPMAATPSRLTVELRYVSPPAASPPPKELSSPRRETVARAPAAPARAPERKVRPKPRPPVLALRTPQEHAFKLPTPKLAEPEPQRAPESAAKRETEEQPSPAPTEQAARRDADELARVKAEEAARQRGEEEARQRVAALEKEAEAKKQAEARRREEALKQEQARREALEHEARKLAEDKARQEAEAIARERAVALQKAQEAKTLEEARRKEEAQKQAELRKKEDAERQAELRKKEEADRQAELRKKQEAEREAELRKQEEAKRLALEVEALKRAEELARQQAIARKELEAKRLAEEGAAREREAAARARADADAAAQRAREGLAKQQAPGPAPGTLPGKELAAKAIDQIRAGRVDPSKPPSPTPTVENPRRRTIAGIERDVMLRMYVEGWRWKIERGGSVNYRPSAAWRASQAPIVTVSIRSDGSLEDVFIHRSSGVRELDEAVRRIARLHAPYSTFPPAMARQYDVIDIRRVWSFEDALRILDEP